MQCSETYDNLSKGIKEELPRSIVISYCCEVQETSPRRKRVSLNSEQAKKLRDYLEFCLSTKHKCQGARP